ncbi:MAG: cytochrome b/b6 domain-containing protein [Candidatus Wallbacteria bacterium]|nr:cytochrome b/b6 domain-containing protein [Candidatus Wallbacteria bacterium]
MKRSIPLWNGILCALAVQALAVPWAAAQAPDKIKPVSAACLECHETWSAGRLELFTKSAHGRKSCLDCHTGMAEYPHTTAAASAYGACAKCHEDAAKGFLASAHKAAAGRGVKAFQHECKACHGEPHLIVKRLLVKEPMDTCSHCHGSKAMSTRLGLPTAVWKTYESSVHGQKRLLGSKRSPSCVDCHGAHRVTPPDSPGSELGLASRAQVCAKCHKGATPMFALTFSHDSVDAKNSPVAHSVSWVYSFLIVFTLLFFGTMIAMELVSLALRRLLGKPIPHPHIDPEERFSRMQRLQHIVVIVTFVVLVMTGLPLLTGNLDSETKLVGMFGGVERAALVHRAAGTLMILATLWHLFWLWGVRLRDELPTEMLPRPGDFFEFRDQLRTYLLVRDEYPKRAGKYGWIEKVEYWAFAWGLGVMGLTGLLLWFPVAASAWLPKGGLFVVQLVHGFEAILATASVFLWHFYQVHLKPGFFPMNWTWLTGREK